jgi:hypothetical protein
MHVTIQLQKSNEIIDKTELYNFHLGIFGSLTPTSDIDVGIRYVGEKHALCKLSFIVRKVEDAFINFIGVKNSLALDIEPYADMYILPNWGKKKREPEDMFFLNTIMFDKNDFKEMLPYVYASIMRNYIKKYKYDEISELTSETVIDDFNKNKSIFNIKLEYEFIFLPEYNGYIENACEKALTYMQMDYNAARQKYYKLVLEAEQTLISLRIQIFDYYHSIENNKPLLDLEKEQVKECMKKISETLIYRQESYVCIPTITHIVRILQAEPQNSIKYPVNKCITEQFQIPYCSIGLYGFLMSAMEQYGFLLRFYNTYCVGAKQNIELCKKKIKKYGCRMNDAITSYNDFNDNNNTNINKRLGGKSKRKRRNKKKKRSTKKLR